MVRHTWLLINFVQISQKTLKKPANIETRRQLKSLSSPVIRSHLNCCRSLPPCVPVTRLCPSSYNFTSDPTGAQDKNHSEPHRSHTPQSFPLSKEEQPNLPLRPCAVWLPWPLASPVPFCTPLDAPASSSLWVYASVLTLTGMPFPSSSRNTVILEDTFSMALKKF